MPFRTSSSIQRPKGLFPCSSLVLYDIRIVGFHARKGPIIGTLMTSRISEEQFSGVFRMMPLELCLDGLKVLA